MNRQRSAAKIEPLNHNDRMMGIDEVLARLGISRSTLYKRIRLGLFPKSHNPIKKGRAQWPLSVVSRWIEESARKVQAHPEVAPNTVTDLPKSTKMKEGR